MRKLIYIVILGCLLSCNQEAQKILTELPNEIENIQNSNEPTEGEKVAIRLSEIAPLSEEALRKAFPKQLKALPLDEDINVLGQQIIGSFGDRKMSLSIADAAGNASQLAAFMINSYEFHKPQESQNLKIVKQERNGMETITDYYKTTGKSEIRFLYNKRFYITFSNNDNSIKLNPDELWEAFDINALKGYKEMNN
jgi:hypothetical protein